MNWLMARLQSNAEPHEALLAAIAVALAIVLLLTVLLLNLRQERQRRRRIARVSQTPVHGPGKPAVSLRRSTADSSIAALDRLIKRLFPNPARLREKLERTGYRITLGQYLLACLLTAALATLGTMSGFGFPGPAALLSGLASGVGLPHLVVAFLGRRRVNRFIALFPEAIDLIVRGLKSGLPISESIKVVGGEIIDPVGTEFRRISDSIRFGMTLTEALWAAAPRIDAPEYRFFVISLSIQQETGGNLAETLENLSAVLRRRQQTKLKIKALSSEAKASAYIIGALPFVMFGLIMMLNYGYAVALFADPRGLLMVGAGLVSFLLGAAVMYKMVRFEI